MVVIQRAKGISAKQYAAIRARNFPAERARQQAQARATSGATPEALKVLQDIEAGNVKKVTSGGKTYTPRQAQSFARQELSQIGYTRPDETQAIKNYQTDLRLAQAVADKKRAIFERQMAAAITEVGVRGIKMAGRHDRERALRDRIQQISPIPASSYTFSKSPISVPYKQPGFLERSDTILSNVIKQQNTQTIPKREKSQSKLSDAKKTQLEIIKAQGKQADIRNIQRATIMAAAALKGGIGVARLGVATAKAVPKVMSGALTVAKGNPMPLFKVYRGVKNFPVKATIESEVASYRESPLAYVTEWVAFDKGLRSAFKVGKFAAVKTVKGARIGTKVVVKAAKNVNYAAVGTAFKAPLAGKKAMGAFVRQTGKAQKAARRVKRYETKFNRPIGVRRTATTPKGYSYSDEGFYIKKGSKKAPSQVFEPPQMIQKGDAIFYQQPDPGLRQAFRATGGNKITVTQLSDRGTVTNIPFTTLKKFKVKGKPVQKIKQIQYLTGKGEITRFPGEYTFFTGKRELSGMVKIKGGEVFRDSRKFPKRVSGALGKKTSTKLLRQTQGNIQTVLATEPVTIKLVKWNPVTGQKEIITQKSKKFFDRSYMLGKSQTSKGVLEIAQRGRATPVKTFTVAEPSRWGKKIFGGRRGTITEQRLSRLRANYRQLRKQKKRTLYIKESAGERKRRLLLNPQNVQLALKRQLQPKIITLAKSQYRVLPDDIKMSFGGFKGYLNTINRKLSKVNMRNISIVNIKNKIKNLTRNIIKSKNIIKNRSRIKIKLFTRSKINAREKIIIKAKTKIKTKTKAKVKAMTLAKTLTKVKAKVSMASVFRSPNAIKALRGVRPVNVPRIPKPVKVPRIPKPVKVPRPIKVIKPPIKPLKYNLKTSGGKAQMYKKSQRFIYMPDLAAILLNQKVKGKLRKKLLTKGRVFTGLERRFRV